MSCACNGTCLCHSTSRDDHNDSASSSQKSIIDEIVEGIIDFPGHMWNEVLTPDK
jgi:hypothetical protein